MRDLRKLLALIAVPVLALTMAACGGDNDNNGGSSGSAQTTATNPDVKGNVSVMAVWSGDEQKAFQAVLDGFHKRYPNVTVKYNSAGDQLPTVLSTAVEGGNPPDIAAVPQPGLMKQFQAKGALKPIDFVRDRVQQEFGNDWVKLGTIDGKLYGFVFKAANKSTVWFNTSVFQDAGVSPPRTWNQFLSNADTLRASGTPAYSLGAADGWTLTDLFENIYLRTAGPDQYDRLSEHQIKWTDTSVKQALTEMKKITGDHDNIAGGVSGALQTEFPDSVSQVWANPPKAAQVMEGDFVAGVILDSTDAKPMEDFDVYDFPKFDSGSPSAVVGGGDTVVMFNDNEATRALVEYLSTADAAEIWARRGGFASPNHNVDPQVYPDAITRKTATALADAEVFRFDMSDLAPADFGATPGRGEWKILQDFLRNGNVDRTAKDLETAAARAYGK
jgi:alpha-glucoside transport system substrate-binding protein